MRSTMQDAALTVPALVRHAAAVHGGLPVTTLLPDGSVGGRELRCVLDAAHRLAAVLADLGISGDARVGTLARNTPAHLAAYIAVPSMGAILHPVNIRLADEDIGAILDAAADEVVLVDADLLPALTGVLAGRRALRHVLVLDDLLPGALVTGQAVPSPAETTAIPGVAVHDARVLLAAADPDAGRELMSAASPDEHDAAAICFTSGSTGRPRGVAYSHRSIYLHSFGIAAGDAFSFGPEHTVLPVVPMFHVLAWGLPYACLLVGAGLALPGPHTAPAQLLTLAAGSAATHAAGVPTVFTRILDHLRADPTDRLPPTLHELLIGGAACPPRLVDDYAERGVAVRHAWGMTEISPLGAVARADPRADADRARRQRLSQGRLASAVEGRLVGADGAVLAADGVSVGELQVRGPWVSARYLDEPEDTARDWLATGDLATLDAEGFVTLTDRVADLVKSGGEWIAPRRIEDLVAALPGVAEVAVVAIPDDVWGQRPVAVLAPAAGRGLPAVPELRAAVLARLPRWQVPDSWWQVDELPRGGTGKVDRLALVAGVRSKAFDRVPSDPVT